MTARDVAASLERIAPLDSGIPNDELGFIYGDADTTVSGVGCVWCAHVHSLRVCIQRGFNMLICHERLWLPAQTSPWYDGPAPDAIAANLRRRALLDEAGLVVYRSHSNWDALPVDGVVDRAMAALALPEAKVIARQKFFAVYELRHACTVGTLRDHIARALDFAGCRLFGAPATRVQRLAFLIGGFGENQLHMPQAAVELGAQALIFGEMNELMVTACLDMGVPVIECLHSVSEAPGIRRQAALLADLLRPVPVEYVPSGATACAC